MQTTVYADEIFRIIEFCHPGTVMIPDDEALFSFQPFQNVLCVRIAEKHIPEDIHRVVAADAPVPVLNHRFIHFLDGGKGTVTELNYIAATEVRIGCEKDHLHPLSHETRRDCPSSSPALKSDGVCRLRISERSFLIGKGNAEICLRGCWVGCRSSSLSFFRFSYRIISENYE